LVSSQTCKPRRGDTFASQISTHTSNCKIPLPHRCSLLSVILPQKQKGAPVSRSAFPLSIF
jgi:hypothetical protein